MKGPITSPVIGPRFPIPNDPISPNPISSSLGARASYSFWSWAYLVSSAWAKALEATTPAAIACKTNGKRLSHFEIQNNVLIQCTMYQYNVLNFPQYTYLMNLFQFGLPIMLSLPWFEDSITVNTCFILFKCIFVHAMKETQKLKKIPQISNQEQLTVTNFMLNGYDYVVRKARVFREVDGQEVV